MNSEAFVEAIQKFVRDSAVESTVSLHQAPPGRRPAADLVARSNWFNALSADDVARVEEMMAQAAHAAVFGFLAVLDGVRTIDTENGRFELFYVGDERSLLNPPDRDLHDLLDRP
ncbi:hypothetical protein [Mitsuaria sp. GD03876]|uniref:hypothetical protein n=1 Tax=Mitsuaria sp. GD03876 TaxID=2975399 RepID=UPI00244B318D|nr:hypothetical protein [Mitsuaria sp. GD03876]MDH0863145.1 hypothetical protein [Mitsuaria sp. GD03876]